MRRTVVPILVLLAAAGCASPQAAPSSSPASTNATTTASPSASPSARPDRTATVTVSGDLLWHDTVYLSAQAEARRSGSGKDYDFGPMFSGIKPIIAGADASICHAEVPVAPPGRPYSNYPVFAAPPAVAEGIKEIGWDACTTASNHSWDQGFAGVEATLDALDANGIKHTGTARSQAEADTPLVLTLDNGLKLGIVEGAYGLNGFELAPDQRFAWTPWDADTLLRRAHAAREAGADIVMVGMHGGAEYQAMPTAEQEELATRLTASPDVDLVYGHHVHVVQPWTRINGKWVAYGMGNLVAQMLPTQRDGYEGVIGRFTFRVAGDGKVSVDEAQYIPVSWNYNGAGDGPIRVIADKELLGDTSRPDHARIVEAEQRTRETVLALGVEGAVEG